ncbi:Dabb family protein, partial [Enterobacter hormaechei]|nr:Dabb family protein [Enterobacter hormaechei]
IRHALILGINQIVSIGYYNSKLLIIRQIMLGKNNLIAHQVLFTFKDGISWDSEKAILAEKVTLNHINEISEIKGWFCGRSTVDRKQSVDFSLIG